MEVMRWVMPDHHGWISNWNLEWRDIKCSHVIFTATFILIVDDVFPDIIVRIRVLDLGFSPSVVNDEY